MYFFSPLAGLPGRFFVATAAVALALALTGCATVPPPNDSMTLAQNLLQGARDAGAADYAPVDLGFAQDKFQLAQAAMARASNWWPSKSRWKRRLRRQPLPRSHRSL